MSGLKRVKLATLMQEMVLMVLAAGLQVNANEITT